MDLLKKGKGDVRCRVLSSITIGGQVPGIQLISDTRKPAWTNKSGSAQRWITISANVEHGGSPKCISQKTHCKC